MATHVSAAELQSIIGNDLESFEWFDITQDRVDAFADATKDHQFIHVDVEKASATPFGGTIAHGFLTLSLLTYLLEQGMVVPENTSVTLNYGSDKVRYLRPVVVGQRIRAKQRLADVTEKKPGPWLFKTEVTVEIEGEETPALIAEILFMHVVG